MRHILLLVVLIVVSTAELAVGQSRRSRAPQFDYIALQGSAAGHTWAAAIDDRGVVAGTGTVSASTMMGTGFTWTEFDGFRAIVENAIVWGINNKVLIVREESPDHLTAQLDARLCAFNEDHAGPRRNEKLALTIRAPALSLSGPTAEADSGSA